MGGREISEEGRKVSGREGVNEEGRKVSGWEGDK